MQNDTRKRNKISAEKKYAIIEEIKQNKTTKSEILRREGLYTADIQRFEGFTTSQYPNSSSVTTIYLQGRKRQETFLPNIF